MIVNTVEKIDPPLAQELRSLSLHRVNVGFETRRQSISEPRIARKCPRCGEVFLVPLSERALLEGYFHCSKCGYVEYGRDRSQDEEKKGDDQ